MKYNLEKIDELLSTVLVSGDSVFALAKARNLLKEVYDMLKEEV